MYFCNCVSPLILFWKKARTSPFVLYVVSILVLIGMWFERFNIIVPSLGHDFYPYTWGIYVPSPTHTMIVIGSFAWVFIAFLGLLPVDLVGDAMGTHHRGQAGGVHSAVRHHRLRVDDPLRRRGNGHRHGPARPASAHQSLTDVRSALHQRSLRRGRALCIGAGWLRAPDPQRGRRRGGEGVKYVFILVLLVIAGAGGLMGAVVAYRWINH